MEHLQIKIFRYLWQQSFLARLGAASALELETLVDTLTIGKEKL